MFSSTLGDSFRGQSENIISSLMDFLSPLPLLPVPKGKVKLARGDHPSIWVAYCRES